MIDAQGEGRSRGHGRGNGNGQGHGPRGDGGVSAVLGALLMLAVMMTLVPGMVLLRGAIADEMEAQREAAERAAWCARHPAIGPPACDDTSPMPAYDCREVELETWVCTPPPGTHVRPTPSPPSSTPAPSSR